MADYVKDLTQTIYEVAKRTSVSSQLVTQAVVLSINPDGSLNVDDGKGGCVRRVPKQNAKVGDTVRIGTEPAIGQTTNLPQQIISVNLTGSCPVDPRQPPPVPHSNVLNYVTTIYRKTSFGYTDPGNGPTLEADWASVRAGIVGGVSDGQLETFAGRSAFWGLQCDRGFAEFATTAPPDGAVLTALSLRLTISDADLASFVAGPPRGPSDNDLWSSNHVPFYIVPSTAPDMTLSFGFPTLPTGAFGDVNKTKILARLSLSDLAAGVYPLTSIGGGQSTFELPFTLPITPSELFISGKTKLALINYWDAHDLAPPVYDPTDFAGAPTQKLEIAVFNNGGGSPPADLRLSYSYFIPPEM